MYPIAVSLLATAPPAGMIPLAACLMWGISAFFLVHWVRKVMIVAEPSADDGWRYDVSRIRDLRRADVMFRLFQPLVCLLARFNQKLFAAKMPTLKRHLRAAGMNPFWLPEEYLGRAELIAVCLSPCFAYFFTLLFDNSGLVIGLCAVPVAAWLQCVSVAQRARKRILAIKRRLPYVLDLLTLLMGAGATFLNALREAVNEFRGQAVAEEFGRVLLDMQMGKQRREAFETMQRRLDDAEITSIVSGILQGEELGTPLAQVLRTQSDVLRIKRIQRAETVASEAGVNMLLPGILVMAATVIIIVGPFVINYLKTGLL